MRASNRLSGPARGTQRFMHCPQCDAENRGWRQFCAQCGARLGSVCSACGQENEPEDHFCGKCGTSLREPPPQPAPSTSETVPLPERRRITVMFIDLVDFTGLSRALDPEDLNRVLRRYRNICQSCTERYQGYVSSHLGDGVRVLFGY